MREESLLSPSIITAMVDAIDEPNFACLIAEQLKKSVKNDSLVMMLYSNDNIPFVIHDEVKEINANVFHDIYMQGAFLFSPLYISHQQGQHGFFTLSQLVPEGFYESEYFHGYYSKSGLTDQLILLIKIDDTHTLAISMGLLSGQYTTAQQQIIAGLTPIITSIVCKHWQKHQPKMHSLQYQLQSAFDLFASSVLTNRERAVVQKLMQGHSSKSAAKALSISIETERSYRKSAYAKLNISSQSELFNLMFSCLRFADKCQGRDPLTLI